MTTFDDTQKYYKRTELARILSVNPMTIYRLIRSGKLEAIRVANDYRIPETAVTKYLQETTK